MMEMIVRIEWFHTEPYHKPMAYLPLSFEYNVCLSKLLHPVFYQVDLYIQNLNKSRKLTGKQIIHDTRLLEKK